MYNNIWGFFNIFILKIKDMFFIILILILGIIVYVLYEQNIITFCNHQWINKDTLTGCRDDSIEKIIHIDQCQKCKKIRKQVIDFGNL